MNLTAGPFTENDARAAAAWRYDAPYDVYNSPCWETVVRRGYGMADPARREREFYSVFGAANELIGYFRLVQKEDHIFLGLGLKPDFCGKGLGKALMRLVLSTAASRFPKLPPRLAVRAMNERAIRCYFNAGFNVIGSDCRETPTGTAAFVVMEYQAH